MTLSPILSTETMPQALEYLSVVDSDLARLVQELGTPPLWAREPGFPTLVHIILEQQVSLASARAAFNKLTAACVLLTPQNFLDFSDEELKGFGFSRQKTIYCRELSLAVLNQRLRLQDLPEMDDPAVRAALTSVKGIGIWSADIYLLMALLRPNSWPSGDLALAISVQELKGLGSRPTPAELDKIAAAWQPWRAVAARLLWYSYLRKRGLA